MYYDLIYLVPVVMAVYAVWFFYPSFTGRREGKISPGEYAWFLLSLVGIPIFGSGLFIAIIFLEFWYANPMEIDIGFVLFICTPWVVISGAIVAYGIRALWGLRNVHKNLRREKQEMGRKS